MTISRIPGRKYFCLSITLALVGVFLALILSLGTSAQNQTLFSDNFEDGNANGWTKSGGSWSVVTDGSLVYRQSGTGSDARARAGSTSMTNYAVQARVKPLAFNGTNRFVALLARAQSMTSYYMLALSNNNQLQLRKLAGGSPTILASTSFTVTTGTWYTLRIEASGATLRGFVNGALLLTATDGQFSSGNVGGATFFSSGEFDDFLVTSLGPGPTPTPTPTPLRPDSDSIARLRLRPRLRLHPRLQLHLRLQLPHRPRRPRRLREISSRWSDLRPSTRSGKTERRADREARP